MNGKIFTFYSYKGGVGRTMALANIAMYFFLRRNLNVLIVDWDLEAPGLERYFESNLHKSKNTLQQKGLVDLIQQYKTNISMSPDKVGQSPYPILDDYITKIDEKEQAKLTLITSGKRGSDADWKSYTEFIQKFDWLNFYTEWEGGGFFDWLRDELRLKADIILIDSRTGFTEMGGIATQQMADNVVMFFAPNTENMENTARIARNLMSDDTISQRSNNQTINIITVPSRVDDSDSQSYNGFVEALRTLFIPLQNPGFGRNPLQDMLLPYMPIFSYQESILFGDVNKERTGQRLLNGYISIASNMIELIPEEHIIRTGRINTKRTKVFISYSTEEYELAKEIKDYLNKNKVDVQKDFHPDSWLITSVDDDVRQIEESICVIVLINHNTIESKLARQVIAISYNIKKTIIPLVTTKDIPNIPIELKSLQFLHVVETQNWKDRILESIRQINKGNNTQSTRKTTQSKKKLKLYISYSRKDYEIVQKISEILIKNDFDVFVDYLSINPGDMWVNATQRAIKDADVLLVFISSSSVQSNYVQSEIFYAYDLAKKILPILLEETALPLLLYQHQTINLYSTKNPEINKIITALNAIEN